MPVDTSLRGADLVWKQRQKRDLGRGGKAQGYTLANAA